MNNSKRQMMQKSSLRGGKAKEAPSSSRHDSTTLETANFITAVPLIRQSDNTKLLPRYSSILGRTEDDGVNMDDLDQLQLDLEKLISTCAVRNRFLRGEIESIDRVEEKRDKKGKSYDKGGFKRKRPDDKVKYRDLKNGARPLKRHYPLPVNSIIGDVPLRHEMPKINLPKNDTSDKFWATVEPYCAPVTNSHATFLDKLIEECSQEIDVKIPELGEYYANEWSDNATGVEQELGLTTKTVGLDLKKNGLSAMVDTFSNPKTQRLLAALIEEKVMTSFPGVTGKLKPSDLNIIKSTGGPRAAICMDRRLKKDLVEQGLLSVEDLSKTIPDDEILQEIKKCQQELTAVNEYNVEELKRLKCIVVKDLKRQEIKAAMDAVDGEVLEVYNKVLMTKQKQIQQAKDEDFDKAAFTKSLKEFEAKTQALLETQFKLQKAMSALHD
ncbi:transcriptional adapter 3-A [Tribolium madens]|uniref:transcriptional adapter 3-A n=1 Tax=Tribolium madens TaxID=41895 RepID=UPI001CF751DD|nr:transcriptional adapter 3-A [Tribolium madens]